MSLSRINENDRLVKALQTVFRKNKHHIHLIREIDTCGALIKEMAKDITDLTYKRISVETYERRHTRLKTPENNVQETRSQ